MDLDLVAVKCAKCDAPLGTVANLWTQIGKKYLTPASAPAADAGLRVATSGAVRLGDDDTLVGGWCALPPSLRRRDT